MSSPTRVVLAALTFAAAALAVSGATALTPKPGQRVPVGTMVTGECKYQQEATDETHYWTEATSTLLQVVLDDGTWNTEAALDQETGCEAEVTTPGKYRLHIVHAKTWFYCYGGGCLPEDTQSDERDIPFEVYVPAACGGDGGHIVDVWTESGRDYNLTGTQLHEGQVINAAERMELTLGDGSTIRLQAGTKVDLQDCRMDEPDRPWKETFNLVMGKIWATVTKVVPKNNDFEVLTQSVCACVRGTEFWISYQPKSKLTTVHVDEGIVEMRKLAPPNKLTVLLRAGQTGRQQGNGAPRRVRR